MSNEPDTLWLQRDLIKEIHKRRKLKGWTNQEMLRRSGVSSSGWDQIQKCRVSPQITTITRILNAFKS